MCFSRNGLAGFVRFGPQSSCVRGLTVATVTGGYKRNCKGNRASGRPTQPPKIRPKNLLTTTWPFCLMMLAAVFQLGSFKTRLHTIKANLLRGGDAKP